MGYVLDIDGVPEPCEEAIIDTSSSGSLLTIWLFMYYMDVQYMWHWMHLEWTDVGFMSRKARYEACFPWVIDSWRIF